MQIKAQHPNSRFLQAIIWQMHTQAFEVPALMTFYLHNKSVNKLLFARTTVKHDGWLHDLCSSSPTILQIYSSFSPLSIYLFQLYLIFMELEYHPLDLPTAGTPLLQTGELWNLSHFTSTWTKHSNCSCLKQQQRNNYFSCKELLKLLILVGFGHIHASLLPSLLEDTSHATSKVVSGITNELYSAKPSFL